MNTGIKILNQYVVHIILLLKAWPSHKAKGTVLTKAPKFTPKVVMFSF